MSSLADLHRFRRTHPEQTLVVQGLRWGVHDSARTKKDAAKPALLLIPGTLGTGEIFWQQIKALSGELRIVAATYPAVADVNRYADGAAALLRRLGIERASILGSSLGGYTVQTLALRHPGQVDKVFIGNSLCNPKANWRRLNAPLKTIEATPAGKLKADRVARVADWPDSDPGLALSKAVMNEQGQSRIPARNLKARIVALLRAGDMPPLPIPDSRIVIIDCADDPVMPPEARAETYARYPKAKRHTLPTGGHFPYVSRAKEYTAILRQHLLK